MTQRIGIFGAAFVFLVACSQAGDATLTQGEGGGGAAPVMAVTSVGQGGAGGGLGTGAGGDPSVGDAGQPADCDSWQMCGDYTNGCTGCAVQTPCAAAYKSCYDDITCFDFNMCVSMCANNDATCQTGCASKYPSGAAHFNALVDCIVCQVCPTSCAVIGSICPK